MDKQQFKHVMSYRRPTDAEVSLMGELTDSLVKIGETLCNKVPPSAERTIALRSLQRARMDINAAIILSPADGGSKMGPFEPTPPGYNPLSEGKPENA